MTGLYRVHYNGAIHINKVMFRKAYRAGDTVLAKLIENKEIAAVKIFGTTTYRTELERAKTLPATDQVPDKEIEEFELTGRTDCLVLQCEPYASVYEYKGFSFVRMRDVPDHRVYRFSNRLAKVHICGDTYIALNAVRKDESSPVIITLPL